MPAVRTTVISVSGMGCARTGARLAQAMASAEGQRMPWCQLDLAVSGIVALLVPPDQVRMDPR